MAWCFRLADLTGKAPRRRHDSASERKTVIVAEREHVTYAGGWLAAVRVATRPEPDDLRAGGIGSPVRPTVRRGVVSRSAVPDWPPNLFRWSRTMRPRWGLWRPRRRGLGPRPAGTCCGRAMRAGGRPGKVRHRNGDQVVAQRPGQYPGAARRLCVPGRLGASVLDALHRAGIGGLPVQVTARQVGHLQARPLGEWVGRGQHRDRCFARVHRPTACMATGASLTFSARLQRKVIQAGRDERTLLRLSRISIARCADLIRSSAYAWGPLSWSVHPVAAARATDQRPCAGDLRPGARAVRPDCGRDARD